MCAYGATLCYLVLSGLVRERGLWAALVRLPDGSTEPITTSRLCAHLMQTEPTLSGLLVFLAIVAVAVGAVLFHNLALVARNTTAYEVARRRRLGLPADACSYDSGSIWRNMAEVLLWP